MHLPPSKRDKIMRVNLNLYENNRNRQSVGRNNVSFGIAAAIPAQGAKRISSTSREIAYKLGLDACFIDNMLANELYNRIEFLKQLASRYQHGVNHKLYPRDTAEKVIKLFNEVSNPNDIQSDIVNHIAGSVDDLSRMFRLVGDRKTLASIKNFKRAVIGQHSYNTSLIPNLLESQNCNEYLRNTDRYASYFKLNLKNPDAVSNLDKMVSKGTYVQKLYDSQYYLGRLYRNITAIKSQFGEVFNDSVLSKYFSREGSKFLKGFFTKYMPDSGISLPKENHVDLVRIYSTTNEKNLGLRLDILNKFKLQSNAIKQNSNIMKSEIAAMRELFDKMDNNPYARKFVKKAISKNLAVDNIKELLTLMDKVSAKKAYIFYKNLSRILAGSKPSEQANAIEKGLMQPFYETSHMKNHRLHNEEYGFKDRANRPGLGKYIRNFINILRYNLTPAEPTYTSEQSLAEVRKLMPTKVSNDTPSVPVKKLKLTKKSNEVIKKVKNPVDVAEVNEIISKKLGKKTLEFQQDEYVMKLTKLRLKLLPEMFDSVKETRAYFRANGIKSDLKNADVVELYSKINGNNRKLVNYMLKKRNDFGNRMFSVNDIVELLDKSNRIIREKKLANPNIKAADVKAYYNDVFDTYVARYGKLKISRKKSSTKPVKYRKSVQ